MDLSICLQLELPGVSFIMENQTLMDTIVKYSKDCVTMRFIKLHLMKSIFLAKRLPMPFTLPSVDSIKIVIGELMIRIGQREHDIRNLLVPLFEGKDFGYDQNDKYSLSISEMKDGYVLLKEVSKRDPTTKEVLSYKSDDYVILLSEVKLDGMMYYPGVLYKVGGAINEQSLLTIRKKQTFVSNELLDIIIKKKTAYEYLE